jgi:hypothetical protein
VIFLLGLGLGGLLYRPALRWGRPEWNLGFCQRDRDFCVGRHWE